MSLGLRVQFAGTHLTSAEWTVSTNVMTMLEYLCDCCAVSSWTWSIQILFLDLQWQCKCCEWSLPPQTVKMWNVKMQEPHMCIKAYSRTKQQEVRGSLCSLVIGREVLLSSQSMGLNIRSPFFHFWLCHWFGSAISLYSSLSICTVSLQSQFIQAKYIYPN